MKGTGDVRTDRSSADRDSAVVASARTNETPESFYASLVSAAGYILAVSYPVLALSTGARALYQLFFKAGVTYHWPAIMSGVAALSYLVAAIGFAYRRRWSWRLSVGALGFETTMTLVVGILSYVEPALVGRTVWRHFGEDYGYFPLFQPIIGLIWLFWPATRAAYGIGGAQLHGEGNVMRET